MLTRAPDAPTDARPQTGRRILLRTRGHGQGPITRLMSPGDLGQVVKPFVFLDHFEMPAAGALPGFPMHPHSGISTHTTVLEGSVGYADSTGKSGTLPPGSVEYMQAGGGVWHTGTPRAGVRLRGFQLWLALPAELELAPAESHYVQPDQIPGDGRVRVLLGEHDGMRSVVPCPWRATYLHVRLRDGEPWRYEPPSDHDVAWLAVSTGGVRVDGTSVGRGLVVFEPGSAAIEVVAEGDTELVIASAAKHPHPLVMGSYSVHTSEDALRAGEAGYRKIAAGMRKAAG